MAGLFAVQFAVGAAVGFAIGHFAVWSLNRLNIDNASLYPILLLSVAFFTFSATGLLHGNGYLAVYLTGMIIGKNRIPYRKEVATFMDGLTWLFQIIMFLMLGLLVNPHEMFRVACVAPAHRPFYDLHRPASQCLPLPSALPADQCARAALHLVGGATRRGPIIFAIYPVMAGVEGSDLIFNIVFFITLLSLLTQGTTLAAAARLLGLSAPLEKTGNEFGVELPDEIDSDLRDMTVTRRMLEEADTLKDMNLPAGTLVMLIKRDDEFLIPNGSLRLHEGDKLLLISENKK